MLKIFGLEYAACVFVYSLINFYPLVISVLYAQEVISFLLVLYVLQDRVRLAKPT
jgi:hypothetical protein